MDEINRDAEQALLTSILAPTDKCGLKISLTELRTVIDNVRLAKRRFGKIAGRSGPMELDRICYHKLKQTDFILTWLLYELDIRMVDNGEWSLERADKIFAEMVIKENFNDEMSEMIEEGEENYRRLNRGK